MAVNESMILFEEDTLERLDKAPDTTDEILDDNTDELSTDNSYNNSLTKYIFERSDVKAIFIFLYTVVFFCCISGNMTVIFAVTFSRRLRSITNFFLANLAIADLCVGIFCIYQTLLNYLMHSWKLGNLLCKVYMFIHSLSYTASILILMLVCIERYLVTVYPVKCKAMLTKRRLTAVVIIVWVISALYAVPKFIYFETYVNKLNDGTVGIICGSNMKDYQKHIMDTINCFCLYLLPLTLMSYFYAKTVMHLWESGNNIDRPGQNGQHISASCRNAMKARLKVIRMLIFIVVFFALCNLPQQIRIIWLNWDSNNDQNSNFSAILTVSTFLISYINCCLNSLFYALFSRNFREGMREIPCCRCTENRRAGRLAIADRPRGENRNENESNENRVV
ncbi:trissin receptor-like [Vespula pensylvanica]|uniref:trissin receptor-like n=1 Tax=Vespula pensylvanica TaxID=30213 RepID=UPI001CBA492A|nr:trissin receptor-like [Vespula pensylvanica]